MDLQITPKKLSGVVTPPSSKSQAHRLLIAAALSGGISIIHGLADSQDIRGPPAGACLPCVPGWRICRMAPSGSTDWETAS